jgi:hypothetical protein
VRLFVENRRCCVFNPQPDSRPSGASSVASQSSCFVRMWSLSWTVRVDWESMTARVVGCSSGIPGRSCSKSIPSVNECLKLSFAVTTRVLVTLRDIHASSILASFGSLNAVIFAMSSRFAYGWTFWYFAYS